MIGNSAFWMSNISYASIPGTCKKIGYWAFKACKNLHGIFLHDGIEDVGFEAFRGCENIVSIYLPESLLHVGEAAFSTGGSPSKLETASQNQRYRFINNCLIDTEEHLLVSAYNNSGIPNDGSVWTIGEKAFADCNLIRNIVIPESIYSIGDAAFKECNRLKTIVFLNKIPEIGIDVFNPDVHTHVFFPESARPCSPVYTYPKWLGSNKEIHWDWELYDGHPEIVLLDERGVKGSLHDYWFNRETRKFTILVHCTNQTDTERFFYLEELKFNWLNCPILPVCSVPPNSNIITQWEISGEHIGKVESDLDARFSFYFRVAKSERTWKHKSDIQEQCTHYFPIFLGE